MAPLQTVEQLIRAAMPAARIRSLLRMPAGEPCLVIDRRTWSGGRPVSVAVLHHPGSRYELAASAGAGTADSLHPSPGGEAAGRRRPT